MVKVMRYMVVFALFFLLISFITYGRGHHRVGDLDDVIQNYPYINQKLLESSRYTQTDEVDPDRMDAYLDTYRLSWDDDQLETMGFLPMFENDTLKVWFEKDSFSMIVHNKTTDYFWSSRPEFQGTSGTQEANQATRRLMNSGLWVEYVRAANVQSSTITTASLYTIADVQFQNDGSITDEHDDPIRPYQIQEGSYSTNRVETLISEQTGTSFSVDVNLKQINVRFTVTIALVDNQIEVFIPQESILETGEIFRLIGIQVFPYFGAAREDKIPGYILIPDGLGALVRMHHPWNTSFQARFYGADAGYATTTLPNLSVPIYGMVHQVGGDAFYVHVAEGAETSQLRATFWGTSTRYHRITARYSVRQIYRSVINRAGEGREAVRPNPTSSDYRLIFNILDGDQANYVGMATDYRDRLIGQDILTNREKNSQNGIPLHLSYIMSDREPSFIGTSKVVMTTTEDVMNSYQSFREAGILNQQTNLYGWSNDGFVNRAPYRFRISGRSGFDDMTDMIVHDGNTVYLHNDYVISSELSSRVSYNRDVARNLSRLKMTMTRRLLNDRTVELYIVKPDSSDRLAAADQRHLDGLGVSGLLMTDLGNTLFSHYDGDLFERSHAIGFYQDIAARYDHLLLDMPNDYLFAYIDGYTALPITNSQYDYYTDLVPLLPIILKGSVSYYTPYLNFNALAEDRLLTMVDFAVNPSYVLTEQPTYEMRFTMANRFYTTTRSDYETEIIDVYHYLNDALSHVMNAYIVHREVIETGLVAVTYSNDVVIYINYSYQSKTAHGHQVAARDYKVVMP